MRPSGTRVEYSRDALGRISAVRVRPTSGGTLTTVVSGITYQPFGPAATYTFATGSQSLAFTHDQNYWVTDVAGSVLNLRFCRDGVANITRLKTSTPACTGTAAEQYAYDALHRLTQVQNGSGGVVEAYSYNLTGDRLGKTQGGVTEPYTYPSPFTSHHLLGVGGDTRLYDAAGNLVDGSTDGRDWTYDERNRLVNYHRRNPGLGADVDYQYNGRGERVAKSGSFSGHYVYDESGLLLTDAGGGAPFGTNYVYADGRPVALVRGSTLYYVHSDHLGTPRAVTAAGSASPMWSWAFQGNPFGEQTPAALIPMNLRFPGQYFDPESAQHYNYFRDYEPGTGRYIESDPIGLSAGPGTYLYVLANPLLLRDPSGLSSWYCGRMMRGLPVVQHHYLCATNEQGVPECGGQAPSGNVFNSPGQDSDETLSGGSCQWYDRDDDDRCFEECLLEEIRGPRPNYAIVGPQGTDCQEWAWDTWTKCGQVCSQRN